MKFREQMNRLRRYRFSDTNTHTHILEDIQGTIALPCKKVPKQTPPLAQHLLYVLQALMTKTDIHSDGSEALTPVSTLLGE